MPRETWVFPSDGSEPYLKGSVDAPPYSGGVIFMPDLPDFVSPIDGQRYSGRAGMREHNKRHRVVPNDELKGLPTLTANADQRSPQQRKADAEHRKRLIINRVDEQYRKYNA